jgi:protein-disulfide isomerase
VDTGLVKVLFYDFPIPAHGFPAVVSHEAAYCYAEQADYWDMHDAIFEAQGDLTQIDVADEEGSREFLLSVAEDLGADLDKMSECLESTRYRPILGGLADTAMQRNINVTPTLLIASGDAQEAVQGFVSFDELKFYLDRAIDRSAGTPVPTFTSAPPR